jgi:hypothetical protein
MLTVATTTTITACIGGVAGRGGDGAGDGTILASVGGISDEDMKAAKFVFWLGCDSGVQIKGEVKSEDKKDYVRFAGDQVADGEQCAMEIRSDEWAKLDGYKWFGVENGQPVKGLAYASDKKKVDKRKLALTLYKLYSKVQGDTFPATVAVEFESLDATLADDKVKGVSLVCGADESYAGKYARDKDAKTATLSFPVLEVAKLKAKTCSEVVVISTEEKKFSAKSDQLVFKEPKKDEAVKLPADGKRLVLEEAPVAAGGGEDGIDVDATGGAPCLSYDKAKKVCNDVTSVPLPAERNYLLAEVHGKMGDGDGEEATYYVAAGNTGLGLHEGATLAIATLAASLKAQAAGSATYEQIYSWYDASIVTLVGDAFDADEIADLSDAKLANADLVHFVPLSIAKVHVHGFHKVDAKELDSLDSARWIAIVKATTTGASAAAEFVVTGADKYLQSKTAPKVAGEKKYFDLGALVKAAKAGNADDQWRIYGLKGGAMAGDACQATKDTYLADTSAKRGDELDGSSAISALDKCEIDQTKLDQGLGKATVNPELYVWEWYTLSK